MRFDRAALRDVVAIHDDKGVLSFYVTADPREEAAVRPAWRIRFGNQLTELREQVSADGDRARRMAVLKRLEGLDQELGLLLNPTESGLGRVLFAPISSDEVWTFSFQLPVADQIVLESTAYVRPLVNTVETAPPAGLVLVSRDGLRMIDYRYGTAEDAERAYFEVSAEDWRQMRGPAASELARQGAAHRDRFERRVEDNLTRLVRAAAPDVAQQAESRGWTTVVLVGDVQLTEVVAAELTGDVIQIDAVVDSLPPAKIAEYAEPQLLAARTRRATELAERAKDAALSGGRGALGMGDTLNALNESRVAQLLLAESREWSGSRTADGRLWPPDQVPQGESEQTLVQEPRMGERMIERALDIDAEVIVLDQQASEALAEFDGLAAILRW
ncbi:MULTISPECIES: VLRF1 family aeRF1-type release factor [Streptosporangium]|uniref:Peptide subunit release factor 1 (ERF1) n=1 Tax=Streptosporangium brasiliense TaxID=47480 RepID=A0ABT9RBK4_9ACTN|nr:VLRF1 family aeRF1-type release factor [Streptosporangium brasiliense]MDP9866640.1 peptide subunit release factor 1 (eRF1) [Streptosporangium brasiliense]